MKKSIFTVQIDNSTLDQEELVKALAQFGQPTVFLFDEIIVDEIPQENTAEVIVYVSPDEDEPYLLVETVGDYTGQELTSTKLATLRFHGVCREFYAEYPRPDRYGAPLYASVDGYAEAEVAGHLFRVAQERFEIHSKSTGDDSSETIWLTIVVPQEIRNLCILQDLPLNEGRIETEIIHAESENSHHLQAMGWMHLCDGHGNARLTGGVWLYKGDKAEAKTMQEARWAKIKRESDAYYAQPYV